jgi:hypothetical protein
VDDILSSFSTRESDFIQWTWKQEFSMSTVSKLMGSSLDGAISMYVEYDDVSMLVTGLRCENTTEQPGYGWVARDTENIYRYDSVWPANQTWRIEVPVEPEEASIPVVLGPKNRLYGVQCMFGYPYFDLP